MAEYRAIRVEKGSGGFGGPLTIQGTEKKNKVMYITGGGIATEILDRIVELSRPPSPSTASRPAPPKMSWRSSSSTAAAPSAAASIPRSASPPSTSTLSARQAPWPSSSRKTSMSPA